MFCGHPYWFIHGPVIQCTVSDKMTLKSTAWQTDYWDIVKMTGQKWISLFLLVGLLLLFHEAEVEGRPRRNMYVLSYFIYSLSSFLLAIHFVFFSFVIRQRLWWGIQVDWISVRVEWAVRGCNGREIRVSDYFTLLMCHAKTVLLVPLVTFFILIWFLYIIHDINWHHF